MPVDNDKRLARAYKEADDLALAVLELTEDRAHVPLETLREAARRYQSAMHSVDAAGPPFTAIEEKIAHAAYVLRRLVVLTGFQAELVVYGGDYEERGTNVNRDCRVSVRREEFESEHLKVLTRFADEHGCDLTINRHGATLRVRQGVHLEIAQNEGLKVNALTTGAASGSGNSANSAASGVAEP